MVSPMVILRKAMFTAAVSLAFLFAASFNPAEAAQTNQTDGAVVQVTVKGTVPDALAGLKKLVASNDMMVMGELHQGNVLTMSGLRVQSESVFVGSPTVGKKLFAAEPGAGVVVPVRINIYADAKGQTVVSYAKPSHLLGTFGNPEVNTIAGMLDHKLHNMVQMLAK